MMTINEKCLQIGTMVKLIEKENTGNAFELARKINVSRSKLYELIDELKNFGIDIKYSRSKGSFEYTNTLRLKVNIPIEVIHKNDYKNISGGSLMKSTNFSTLMTFQN